MHRFSHHQATAETGRDPIDAKLLVRVLIELNIARKNVLIYPPGHAQIQASVGLTARYLRRFLENCGEIKLGFVRNTIWVGAHSIDPNNAVLKELALAMRALHVAALRIRQGFSSEELMTFLQRLAQAPGESVTWEGGPVDGPEGRHLDLGHIAIDLIDYRLFGHTEEAEIHRKDADAAAGRTESLWNDYIRLLTAKDDAPGNRAPLTPPPSQLTPSALAGIFNQSGTLEQAAQKSYEKGNGRQQLRR